MTRGVTTLETMVQDLRLETRRSANANIGKDELQSLKRILYRTQLFLYWDFSWPHLKCRRDTTLQDGQRYYDAPVDMDFENIEKVRANGNGQWKTITRGVTTEHYDVYDSDNNEKSYPIQHFDIIDAGAGEQLEVWPTPDQDGELMRLEGRKKLGALLADADVCTLDDTLIVMFAAAHLLTSQDDRLAEKCLSIANNLYRRLRGGAQRREGGFVVMGSEVRNLNNFHNNPQVLAVKTPST